MLAFAVSWFDPQERLVFVFVRDACDKFCCCYLLCWVFSRLLFGVVLLSSCVPQPWCVWCVVGELWVWCCLDVGLVLVLARLLLLLSLQLTDVGVLEVVGDRLLLGIFLRCGGGNVFVDEVSTSITSRWKVFSFRWRWIRFAISNSFAALCFLYNRVSPAVVLMLALISCSHFSPLRRKSCRWASGSVVACIGRCLPSSFICSNCFWCRVMASMYLVKDCLFSKR